jgi:6-phosphogluconolactonase
MVAVAPGDAREHRRMPSPLRSAQLLVAEHAAGAADAAAWVVAATIGQAIVARGRAVVGFSGGTTPALMFAALASGTDLPVAIDWSKVIVAQVDERWAPQGDPARNVAPLHDELLSRVGVARDTGS